MRKSKLLLLSVLFILPIMLFVGCEDPKYFSITTSTSNGNIGSVSGGNNTFLEGSEISLVATSRNSSANPFICWIKDYSEVVSFDATTVVTVNQETQGNYTALFEESSPVSMTYATISEITYNGPDYFNVDYYVYCAPMNNTTQERLFTNGTISPESPSNSPIMSVFSLWEKSSLLPIGYIFTVSLEITNLAGENVANNLISFQVDSSRFDENTGFYTYSNNGINIKFEKITKNTFAK